MPHERKNSSDNYLGPLADLLLRGHLTRMANAVRTAEDYAAFVDDLATMLRKEHSVVWSSNDVAEIMRLQCCALAMRDEIDDWDEGARRLVMAVCGSFQPGR